MLGAAPEDVVMRAGNDLYRVKLDIAELFDDAEQVGLTRRWAGQRLGVKPEPARVCIGYAQGGGQL